MKGATSPFLFACIYTIKTMLTVYLKFIFLYVMIELDGNVVEKSIGKGKIKDGKVAQLVRAHGSYP